MNQKRIIAIGKLVLLFGTPLALLLGLFSSGVYCGVKNRASITQFERNWLGLDGEADAGSEPDPSGHEPGEVEGEDAKAAPTEQDGTKPAGETKAAETKAAETKAAETKVAETKAADTKAGEGEEKAPSEPVPDSRGAIPAPLPTPKTRVDPLESDAQARLEVPVVVRITVLVDEPLVAEHPDWISYVQRTVSRASQIYSEQFGIRFELWGVSRWSVASEGMSAGELLAELKARPRDGADLLVGFTGRIFDGDAAGKATSPSLDDAFNGAHGVIYRTPGHRQAHLRTLLHEVALMFGAKDVDDPEHADWKGGSWMSYADVPETQAPWIDKPNRQRVLERKDRPFAPDAPTTPPPADDPADRGNP